MMFYAHIIFAGMLILLTPLAIYLQGRKVAWLYFSGAFIYFGEGRTAGRAGELMEQRYWFIASGLLALAGVFILIMTRKPKVQKPIEPENVGPSLSEEAIDHA